MEGRQFTGRNENTGIFFKQGIKYFVNQKRAAEIDLDDFLKIARFRFIKVMKP